MSPKSRRRSGASAPLMFCTPVVLPDELLDQAALMAVEINPANAPTSAAHALLDAGQISMLIEKRWPASGVDLTVGFMEATPADLRDRILSHLNAWAEYGNARFRWSQTSPQIRLSRGAGGYWSYLGTDCMLIPTNAATMNLQGFTMQTPESEYRRVVRHEAGHALGLPHEHARRAIVALLDEAKTAAYFKRRTGWNKEMVRQQIFVPLEERSIIGSSIADQTSIMTYEFSGECTRSGKPIVGGMDISSADGSWFGKFYPNPVQPPPPPPPSAGIVFIEYDPATHSVRLNPAA